MDYLRIFAEEYGLRAVMESLVGQPGVQGAVLTIDELWLTAWRFEDSGRYQQLNLLPRYWMNNRPFFGTDAYEQTPWLPRQPLDLNWRPPFWDEMNDYRGEPFDRLPITLVICLRPPVSGERITIPDLPQVLLPIRFEVRPIARLSAEQRKRTRPIIGGISVGSGNRNYGTLGGVVEDQSGKRFGMTCSHVFPYPTSVDQPAQYDDTNATSIGTSVSSIPLQACSNTGACDRYGADPHVRAVDTTLIEVEAAASSDLKILSIGPLAGVVSKNSLVQGQQVMFEGRTSGHRICEVGGAVQYYKLELNGQSYCFRDLFEIRWISFTRSLFGPLVKGGDSGSWVCSETDQGPGWCGQVIGDDRHIGYVAYAESTIEAWSNIGKTLRVN